jgi:DNA-binding NarL/FixJ family response regulator
MTKIRVLIVDDHEVMRKNIRKLLSRSADIDVVGEAVNGLDALQQIETLQPDVMLLDMEMPVMNGPEVATKLHEQGTNVRILALSAYNDREYVNAMLEQGASGYITKDEAPRIIVDAIRGVMEGKQVWLS